MSSDEYTKVELPFIEQLQTLALPDGTTWEYLEGDEHVPQLTERDNFQQVLLTGRLIASLRRRYSWLDDRRINQALSVLERVSGHGLFAINENVHGMLTKGVKVDGDPDLHGGRQQTVYFIDLEEPTNNDYLAINQFRVDPAWSQGAVRYSIPDIVCFVNGIPLVVIECKSPNITAPMESAINDLLSYANLRDDLDNETGVERLFYTNLLMIGTHFDDARSGTISARHKHYLQWKDTAPIIQKDIADSLGVPVEYLSQQQTLVAGMLHPANLIDLLANFTLFKEDDSSGKHIKIVARYHQYRAVLEAIHRLRYGKTHIQDGQFDWRGGIVWHTQGSGKSLSMVFLIRKMRRTPALANFKVVVVTDRVDLQTQLSNTATLAGETVSIAKSSARLQELLEQDRPGLIFGMLQKNREKIILNESENILVIIDEAHRSHTKTFHANLRKALRNSAMIGFTGTPILKGHKNETAGIFGSFIDIYSIEQAVKDGATVKILYEGNTAKGVVEDKEGLNQRFEQLFNLDDYTPQELEAIRRKYGTLERLFEAKSLIRDKAKSMLFHYVATVMPNDMKAMVVASSRLAAVRYQKALVEAHQHLIDRLYALPDELKQISLDDLDQEAEETRFYVSAYKKLSVIERLDFAVAISRDEEKDGDRWHEWTDRRRIDDYIARFKKPLTHSDPEEQDGMAFLCVSHMLLTGFDAPVAQVLYLDRSIQQYTLLQAVARVNRTYPRKNHGLVVDYYGVAHYLKQALDDYYDPRDIEGALNDISEELPVLEARHHDVLNVFANQGIHNIYTQEDECVYVLKDIRTRAEFTVKFKLFVESLDIVLPRVEALAYTDDAVQLRKIQIRARNRYRDQNLNLVGVGHKVQSLIDEFVVSKGIDLVIEPISIMDVDEFNRIVNRITSDRDRAAEMEHAARYHIRQRKPEDPMYYGNLSQRLDELLQQHQDNWVNLAAALSSYIQNIQRDDMRDLSGLGKTEARFFRLLSGDLIGEVNELTSDDRESLIQLTQELVQSIRDQIHVVDFWRRKQEQEKLRLRIYKILQSINVWDDHINLLELTDRVLELAKYNHVALTT